MASKRRNMFYQNMKQETTEIESYCIKRRNRFDKNTKETAEIDRWSQPVRVAVQATTVEMRLWCRLVGIIRPRIPSWCVVRLNTYQGRVKYGAEDFRLEGLNSFRLSVKKVSEKSVFAIEEVGAVLGKSHVEKGMPVKGTRGGCPLRGEMRVPVKGRNEGAQQGAKSGCPIRAEIKVARQGANRGCPSRGQERLPVKGPIEVARQGANRGCPSRGQ
ncbi:hypothetical protein AAG570_005688 [Ranatra chinensis]|uniref:Uncharacterized protein n=1 Tax=Ranatra chinensis TaxID=642074 RepID=A0ABD0YAY8_9HEMI